MAELEITIQSMLKRKHFEEAYVVTGHSSLHRTFKWIHILETLELENLIKGREMILTTGVQIANDDSKFLTYIQKLHAIGAAGLCIEFGPHVTKVPVGVIEYANEVEFPIIVLPNIVPFVEITQDIHRHLINQQYELLQHLETYAQELYKLTLSITNYEQILMRLHKYLNVSVVFELRGEETLFLPNLRKENFRKLLNIPDSTNLLSIDIYLFDQPYGKLYIYHEKRVLTEFDMLILDRTAGALSNYLLRDLYIDEKKENVNRQFLNQWLNQSVSKQEILQFLEEHAPKTFDKSWFVFLQSIHHPTKKENLTYQKLFVRNILEKHGFFAFTFENDQNLVFIVADLWQRPNLKERLLKVINQLTNIHRQPLEAPGLLAVGHFVAAAEELSRSYISAKNTMYVRKKNPQISIFSEDIPLHHMILQLKQNEELIHSAQQCLKPLIEYDQVNNGQLIKTLKKYLEFNCLKKETAQALFIVRQTLYHRLEKIEQLLGQDCMIGEKRLALEMMLHLIDIPSQPVKDSFKAPSH